MDDDAIRTDASQKREAMKRVREKVHAPDPQKHAHLSRLEYCYPKSVTCASVRRAGWEKSPENESLK